MIFIVNYYQYKVRCNKAIPDWNDIFIFEGIGLSKLLSNYNTVVVV
ncbi:hypothetical protein [Wolbachia endosymbiont (group A) of Bibio marci]|nr:hypothetical protein [Wolbachia endosymbiont (group A) of Bibio marci]